MAEEKKASYSIAADPTEFETGFRRAATAAKEGAEQIKGSIEGVQAVVEKFNSYVVSLTAVLAGGKLFGDAVKDARDFAGEVGNLSKKLGVSTETASGMVVTMRNLGVSTDDYIDASMKLVKQVNKNEDGLRAMGLQTRDSGGHFKNLNQLTQDALDLVRQYKEGTDRAAAAQAVFGKGGEQVLNLLKLTNKEWEEGAEDAERLGIVLGKDAVDAVKEFKRNTHDLGDAQEALSIRIGNTVIPTLNKLIRLLITDLPAAVAAGKESLAKISDDFWLRLVPALKAAAEWMEAFDKALDNVRPEWLKKRRAAYEQAVKDQSDFVQQSQAEMKKLLRQQDEAMSSKQPNKPEVGRDFNDPNAKSRMALFEAELAERKLKLQEQSIAEGRFYAMRNADEQKFWQDKLKLTRNGSEEQIAVRKKIADAGTHMLDEEYKATVANLQAQEAQYRFNTDARIVLLNQEGEYVKQKYGEQSQQYQEVQKRIVEAKRQEAEQIRQIEDGRLQVNQQRQQAELDMLGERLTLERDLMMVLPEQAIQAQLQLEDQRNAIVRDGLEYRLSLAKEDPDRNAALINQIYAQREQAEIQHQQRKSRIVDQGERERLQYVQQFENQAQSGLQNVFAQTMNGSMRMGDVVRNSYLAIGSAITSTLAAIAARWIINNTMATLLGGKSALGQISANAATAGSAAVASTAAIPLIGPELAPAAGAAAYAEAMTYSALIPSAAGGYDIPTHLDPIVQLHEEEMVLPKAQANAVRDMANGDANQEQQPLTPNVTVHISALDGPSVARVLQNNPKALLEAIEQAWRKGYRPKK